jgi:hypothetical protein
MENVYFKDLDWANRQGPAHRYYYYVDGERLRGFEEQWEAEQYADEDRANVQSYADETGAVHTQYVYDDHDTRAPVFTFPVRPKLKEQTRPTLGDLLVSTARAMRRKA